MNTSVKMTVDVGSDRYTYSWPVTAPVKGEVEAGDGRCRTCKWGKKPPVAHHKAKICTSGHIANARYGEERSVDGILHSSFFGIETGPFFGCVHYWQDHE